MKEQYNNASNLEWCTRSENERHARMTGLKRSPAGRYLGKNNKLSKPFVCVETGKVYYCQRELWEELGFEKNCCSHITRACRYGYMDRGFHWRYYEPNELVKLLFEKGYRKYPLSYDGDIWYCYVQMACRWLREEKGIHISADIYKDSSEDADGKTVDEWTYWAWDFYWLPSGNIGDEGGYDQFDSYEDAIEAALEYCLTNLI